MKLTNTTGSTVHLPTLGLTVEDGETIEVTGDDAKSLQAQGWKRSDRPKKRATKNDSDDDSDETDAADAADADPDPGAETEEAPASDEGA